METGSQSNFSKMKISIVIAYYLLVITVLESSQKLTWFEAQTLCRDKNQTLTLNQNESNQVYWTGFYKRTSHWIKIIGCYEQSTTNTSIIHESDLTIMAPGFCQEICLDKNASLFGVQARRCVCLSKSFDYSKNQKLPSECSYTCNNSTLLTGECGGESAYNVYMTDLSRLEISSPCLSLQCGDPKFLDFSCDSSLPPICRHINLTTIPTSWRENMEHCKENNTYLIGNANIYAHALNVTSACSGLKNGDPRWIGVVRDQYVKSDQGQPIEKSDHHFVNSCQKCEKQAQDIVCTYGNCSTPLTTQKVICDERVITVTPQSTTTERVSSTDSETVSTMDTTQQTEKQTVTSLPPTTQMTDHTKSQNGSNLYITNKKENESPVAAVVVPVVLVIVLAVCGAVVALYIRRKKQSQDKKPNGANKSTPLTTECYSDIDNNINKNYFVLQQNNPSYELADDIQIHTKVESPYNEAEDGTYDNLGDKDARKQPVVDDTYNHASIVMSPDLSDYDVANHKQVLEEDNTYDHTNPTENSYGHFNQPFIPTQEADYSDHELF